MIITVNNLQETFDSFKLEYSEARQEFNDKKTINQEKFNECIKLSGYIVEFFDKLNVQSATRYPEIIRDTFFIRSEILLSSVGINTSKGTLTDHEKGIFYMIITLLRKVFTVAPMYAPAMELFKICFIYLTIFLTDIDEIEKHLTQVLLVYPYDYQLQYNMGFCYQRKNNLEKAIEHYKLAIGLIDYQLNDNDSNVKQPLLEFKVKSLNGIGGVYYSVQDRFLAKYFFELALEVMPNDPDIHNQLGVVYTELRITDKAIEHYQLGIENITKSHMTKDYTFILASMYMNMGLAKCYECDFESAIECYNKALEYKPDLSLAYQNKLLDLNYISHRIDDPMYIARMHKNINHIYTNVITDYSKSNPGYVVKQFKTKYALKKSTQRINLGFVSGDFICHPVSYYIMTILKNLDRNMFNLVCYSTKLVKLEDNFPKCKWVVIKGMDPLKLKNVILEDQIDILFDLSGHTGDNRLDTFVLKPAPIQISYIGYPGTSGIKSMDYHITDRICNSKDTQKYYTEKLLFMPNSFLSYTQSIDIEKLPIKRINFNGKIVFGCFNRNNKINELVISTWEKILSTVPNSILLIKTKEFVTEKLKVQFLKSFSDQSLLERIDILEYSDTYPEHLPDYNRMDIALDTFPYSGTTTSCEALLMGVPVLTLKDTVRNYHSQNVTSSLMFNSNLPDYITTSQAEYISKAQELASKFSRMDTSQCNEFKKDIRQSFINGKVYHTNKDFVRDFEDLLVSVYSNHFNQ